MKKTITAIFGIIEILSNTKIQVTFDPDFFDLNDPEHDMDWELNALVKCENDPLLSDIENALNDEGYNLISDDDNHSRNGNVVTLNIGIE